jgi:hypothetical protein
VGDTNKEEKQTVTNVIQSWLRPIMIGLSLGLLCSYPLGGALILTRLFGRITWSNNITSLIAPSEIQIVMDVILLVAISILNLFFLSTIARNLVGLTNLLKVFEKVPVGILPKLADDLLILIAVLSICASFSSFVVLWLVDVRQHFRAIQVASFLLGLGCGIVYYLNHKDQFPSGRDKIEFFLAVSAAPPALIQILFSPGSF